MSLGESFFCCRGSRDKLEVGFIQSILRSPYLVHLRVIAPPASIDTPVPVGAFSGLRFAASSAHPSVVVLKSVPRPPLGHPNGGKWL